ncbi:hypothetical protein PsorP6_001794 [Peronosclerospora sorghi]|uniref:Uncharacterized protein n=1 Tax=Peronosclerospora sorghi TaxID=230839 RepID=A0ACC0WRW1_9STRA|nr:hypothetical protein PsorP6_001794 [Peronosclerospora sorghi]
MKMRWYSCIDMRSRLSCENDMHRLIKWVLTSVILHNALAHLVDRWSDLSELEEVELDRVEDARGMT